LREKYACSGRKIRSSTLVALEHGHNRVTIRGAKDYTRTTISYIFYNFNDRGPLLVFRDGDAYQIHRCLTVLDQPGRGKGDLCGLDPSRPDPSHPINLVTGTPFWTHELVEPSFSWNNVYTLTNTAWGFGSQFPQCKEGRDFYNLGKGFPPNSTPSQVSAILTKAINGVPYTTTFTYPHPYALIPLTAYRIAN